MMDITTENLKSHGETADVSALRLSADATMPRTMNGLHGSSAKAEHDTITLVQNGTLPALHIDGSSSSVSSDCDTSYTKDDWNNERIKTFDTLKQVDQILDHGDLPAFKKLFADPNLSPDVRTEFFNQGGKAKIGGAFGEVSLQKTQAELDAFDYAQYGQLSLPSVIKDKEGFFGLDRDGVEKAIKGMTPAEQDKFMGGKLLADANAWPRTGEQRENLSYYEDVHETLKGASGYSFWGQGPVDGKQLETWEKEIATLPSPKTDSMDTCSMQKAEVREELKKTYDQQFQDEVNEAAHKIVEAILLKQRLSGN